MGSHKLSIFLLILTAILLGIIPSTNSQPFVSDSLIRRLTLLNDSVEMVSTLNALAIYYSESDPERALYYSKRALSLANQLKNVESCAFSNMVMGQLFEIKHNFQPTINYYLISIKHFQKLKNNQQLARLYNKLGQIYITNNYDYNQGMSYFNKALEHASLSDDKKEMALAYNSIGGIFYYQKDYTAAAEYFQTAYQLRKQIGDQKDIAASLNNIGEIYRLKEDFNTALDYYNQAIAINQKYNLLANLAVNYRNMGLTYSALNEVDNAENYFKKSAELDRKSNNTEGIIKSLLELGKHYNQSKQFDVAIKTYLDAVELSKMKTDLAGLRDANEGLSIAYEGKENLKKAFEHFKLFTSYKDSIFSRNKAEQLDEMQTRFALDLKEKELELKDNEIALLQRESKITGFQQLLLVLSLLLLVIFSILIYGKLQNRNKKNQLLLSQKEAINKAREELMEAELKNKSNELTNFALHLGEKNKFLHELKTELKNLRNTPVDERESRIKELTLNVQQNLQIQKDLDEFQKTVDSSNKEFFQKLKGTFPSLTKNEERLCAMLRLNLSSKEIAALNNTSIRAVEMGRYRLRKKLQLGPEQNIITFLQEY